MTSESAQNIIFTDRHDRTLVDLADKDKDGTFVIWLYAFSSVVIISICGLVPIVCMPRLQRTRYQNDLLQFLIGLAIGTLTADALLHLLPLSSMRHHSHDGNSTGKAILDKNNNIGHFDDKEQIASTRTRSSLMTTIASTTTSAPQTTAHNHDHNLNSADTNSHHHGHGSHHHDESGFAFGLMALVGILGFLVLERIMVLLTDVCTHKEHSVASSKTDSEQKSISVQMSEPHLHQHQNHHQHQHHHLNSQTRSFMFMIITGDGLHNFFDGIAIGVSYGSSLTVGLSTSIAILCHELPHEIGDFAVLIKAGMPIKRAVLYNTLSSILCLLGATTGVFIGKIDVGWVSSLIAGMFLYISLVDMVPQLDCYPAKAPLVRAKKLFVQLVGIGLGVLIMSVIALYESRLHSSISAMTG